MKKRTVLLLLIAIILAACFNLIFFINLKNPIAQTWISYGFINFAFLMMVFSSLSAAKSKSKYLFIVVNTSISVVYFVINIIISLISIFAKVIPVKWLLCIYIILTTIYLIIFLSMLIIGEKKE